MTRTVQRTHLAMVRQFMEAFGQEINELPSVADFETRQLRYKLIEEELTELYDALKNRDLVGIADALVDLEYVVLGAFHAFGLGAHHEALFREVQRSNMTKLDENGKPVFNNIGKVTKGPHYEAPKLREILGL